MKCPICNTLMKREESLKGKTNTPNILKYSGEDVECITIDLFKCPTCGHGAIEDILEQDFYEEFTVALDDKNALSCKNERNARFEKLLSKLSQLSKTNKSLLEVGSGCGYLLKEAENYFEECVGVEPSKTEAEIARKLGLEIICDYFTPNIVFEGNFSAFISTMVFEHLPNPKESIHHIYNNLEYGGAGMIQVPNGQRAFSNGVYFDIYPQHLHYFTPLSLCKLVTDVGFEIISLSETEDRNYLEIFIRKPRESVGFCKKAQIDSGYLNSKIEKYTTVGVWGGSYAARSYMRMLHKVQYIFDISYSKIGGYIAGSNIKISYPEKQDVEKCELIIIMANEYTREIKKAIIENYDFKGEIVYFDVDNNLCSEWIGNE